MSIEAVSEFIFKGNVTGAIRSSVELYSATTKESLKSKSPMDNFGGLCMAGFAPIMLPLVAVSAAGGAVVTRVGMEINSRRSRK